MTILALTTTMATTTAAATTATTIIIFVVITKITTAAAMTTFCAPHQGHLHLQTKDDLNFQGTLRKLSLNKKIIKELPYF